MSANNVVWCMLYKKAYHVFYSGCMDNTPTEPDYKDKNYFKFSNRRNALLYAHNVVNNIDELSLQEGFVGVEYGVCEITIEDKPILKLVIDHKTKATRVIGFVYEDIGIEACKDGFCLPVGGVAFTVCEVKFH